MVKTAEINVDNQLDHLFIANPVTEEGNEDGNLTQILTIISLPTLLGKGNENGNQQHL